MGIVTTIPEKCKRCYTCIRECPAKAIKVENGQATVIEERCIACGNCVKVCAQKAKHIEDGIERVRSLLGEKDRVVACLAPSFPAAFHLSAPGKIIAGVRKLGFSEVWEVAFGAELVAREYAKLMRRSRRPLVSTPCPAIVSYVEKYLPELHPYLARVVSPMIATARAVRHRYGKEAAVVFIGPCIAKKGEIKDPHVAGMVDAVLTYEELEQLFAEQRIEPGSLAEDSFDSPPCSLGKAFPISGGLLKTAGLKADILDNRILTTEGKERAIAALTELAEKRENAHFLDLLFCEGCINGPKMLNDLSVFSRKEILAAYIGKACGAQKPGAPHEIPAEYAALDMSREFSKAPITLREPSDEEIRRALKLMKKEKPEDQLNCGACGYMTCREKAVAVCQGLAEPEMCLPYIVDELETSFQNLEQSHKELADAQAKLVQTEKLASMGQISAGIAHEINNPLGTILLYSHLLLQGLKEGSDAMADLQMIVNEASRCRKIMRGLLDFARHSRISRAPTEIGAVIREVADIMSPKKIRTETRLRFHVQQGIPEIMVDADQIKQMLINLIQNGLDAIDGSGEVSVKAWFQAADETLNISVQDSGHGIPEENLAQLFTPFFTTKEKGKGTGLGLAITYGVVKMHSGDISVDSQVGRGTKFTVSLPLKQKPSTVEPVPLVES